MAVTNTKGTANCGALILRYCLLSPKQAMGAAHGTGQGGLILPMPTDEGAFIPFDAEVIPAVGADVSGLAQRPYTDDTENEQGEQDGGDEEEQNGRVHWRLLSGGEYGDVDGEYRSDGTERSLPAQFRSMLSAGRPINSNLNISPSIISTPTAYPKLPEKSRNHFDSPLNQNEKPSASW